MKATGKHKYCSFGNETKCMAKKNKIKCIGKICDYKGSHKKERADLVEKKLKIYFSNRKPKLNSMIHPNGNILL